MEAINYISDWITWLLIIIPAGASFRVVYCALQKSLATDLEAVGEWNVKIRQTIKGAVVGLTIAGTITIVKTFYGF